MFFLKVLGALSLERGDSPLDAAATQKRRLGLLAILAIAGSRSLSREKLQCYLWPESSADKSRHALDQLLYATRRALGADPFLAAPGRDLRLAPEVIQSDIARFEDAIRAKAWSEAVASYGGALLDGVHLSDEGELEGWISSERTRLKLDYERALETLARGGTADGDTSAAIGWWRKLAHSDPLSSRIALETIKALAANGDNAAAIQYAHNFQQTIRSELGVEADIAIQKFAAELAPTTPRVQASQPGSPKSPHTPRTVEDSGAPLASLAETPIVQGFRGRRWIAAAAAIVILAITIAALGGVRSRSIARAAQVPGTKRPVDPSAHILYMRGLNAWSARSKEGLDTAVIYFRRATEVDPSYAEAYAGLANAYVLLGYSGFRPGDAMFPKAKAAALHSMELDSTLAAPHAALAHVLMSERDFAGSEAEFKRAIALDPNYATAHQWYAMLLYMVGRINEAVAETGRAAQLDPLSLQIQNTYATFLGASGQREAALRQYEKVVGEEPDSAWVNRNPWLLTNMANVYAANGMFDKAIRTAELATKVVHNHPRAVLTLVSIYIRMGKPQMARRVFERADTTNEQYPAHRGLMYAKLGQVDSAFLWFDRVPNWGIPVMMSLRNDGQLAPIRKDPRFDALVKRLGLDYQPRP